MSEQTTEPRVRQKKRRTNYLLWGIITVGLVLMLGTLVAVIDDHYPNLISDALAKLSPAEPEAPSTGQPEVSATGASPSKLTYSDIEGLLKTLTPSRRAEVVADAGAFERLVREEAVRLSVLDAARASGLASDERVAYLMERASDQILFNTFMQVQASSKMPTGFPSEAQIERYYEQNRAKYRLEQHVPVWQIFIRVPPAASAEEEGRLEILAVDLSEQVRSGKMSFADAALGHSEHDASRIQGGYMGAIRVSQLLPEVRAALPALAEGEVSQPIRAKEGYHIVKRGTIIEAQDLPLPQIRGTIQMELRRAAVSEIQRAVINASVKQFATSVSAAELEAWRAKLSAGAANTE